MVSHVHLVGGMYIDIYNIYSSSSVMAAIYCRILLYLVGKFHRIVFVLGEPVFLALMNSFFLVDFILN